MTSAKFEKIWIDRFPHNPSDALIANRVKIPAIPLVGLGVSSADIDSRKLEAGLKRVYLPNSNVADVIRRFSSIGRAHAIEYFPDIPAYVSGMYGDVAPPTNPMPICFTALAGVGKTQLMKAFERFISTFTPNTIAGVDGIPNVACWYMSVNERATLNQLLRPILESADSNGNSTKSALPFKNRDLVMLLQKARRRAHRDGVSMVFSDEFQFLTHSQDATALITKLIYQLWTLGPRLVFVSNYSLIHKLKRRPDHDRDRLLSNPIVLHPCPVGSSDWSDLLNELFRVGPDVFCLSGEQHGEALHQFTFGINRRLVDLLVLAYRMKREEGKGSVAFVDIERAQRSAEFSAHRETVNLLIEQSITMKMKRPDLWCPFQGMPQNNVIHSNVMADRFASKIQNDQLRSSLTSKERAVVAVIEGVRQKSQKRATVVSIGKPKDLTPESLLNGEASFEETL